MQQVKRCIFMVLLVFAVFEAPNLFKLPYLHFFEPRDPQVELRGILEKQVREMLKVTVLEITVVSDSSHPTEFRRAKGCVGDFCHGSFWAIFDWRALVRMSYDLSTISPSYNAWMPPPTKANAQVWELCLPPVAVDVELPAEKVNYRIRRVGAFLDNQEAARWEQEMFHAISMHVRKCYAQDAALRDRAQDVLKTKLDNALLSVRSQHNVIVNYLFTDDTEERHGGRSLQRATGAGAVGSEGLSSLPNCDQILHDLHHQ